MMLAISVAKLSSIHRNPINILHFWNLAWNLQMDAWKRKSFWECSFPAIKFRGRFSPLWGEDGLFLHSKEWAFKLGLVDKFG